jgi:hypothetical protein
MNENLSLNDRFPNCYFTPMERIALTANGNLQRIFASYYDTPVSVKVVSCVPRQSPPHHHHHHQQQQQHEYNNDNNNNEGENNTMIWDRVVHIQIYNQTVCKATSVIQVNCPTCCELINSHTVGIAQMFRYLNRLPTFTLLNAGRGLREKWEEGKEVNDDDHDNNVDEFSLLSKNGGIWRTYELQCEEMSCLIHEEFASDAWNIMTPNMIYT